MDTPHHFLVIDDDTLSNVISQFTILRCDAQANIKLFAEPEEALEFIETNHLNNEEVKSTIMFLDINMPSMSGWEFLEAFEILNADIQKNFKVYMLSSSIDQSDKERAASHELVFGFIPKPLSVDSVNKVLEEYSSSVSTVS